MAPEIIANKTRSVPYDRQVDIWSLGITLLELAEKDPPLSQMNPMRALMQIPLREPPTLSKPDDWSSEFADFLAQCLHREPRKRVILEKLFEHPWLVPPLSFIIDCLVPLFLTSYLFSLAHRSNTSPLEKFSSNLSTMPLSHVNELSQTRPRREGMRLVAMLLSLG